MDKMFNINIFSIYHYWATAISFIFGAFLEEWLSGRILVKEPKGTKLFSSSNSYLKKKFAIPIRIAEIMLMALISIPLSYFLIKLLEQSKAYIFIITLIIFNTIYLGTLIELPYKMKLWEIILISVIYLLCIIIILLIKGLIHTA